MYLAIAIYLLTIIELFLFQIEVTFEWLYKNKNVLLRDLAGCLNTYKNKTQKKLLQYTVNLLQSFKPKLWIFQKENLWFNKVVYIYKELSQKE